MKKAEIWIGLLSIFLLCYLIIIQVIHVIRSYRDYQYGWMMIDFCLVAVLVSVGYHHLSLLIRIYRGKHGK